MAKSDQAKFEEFLRFQDTYLNCDACKAACQDGQVSSKHPEKYLRQVHAKRMQEKHRRERALEVSLLEAIPAELRTVVSLQQEDGRWNPSEELSKTVGCISALEPPEGIQEWRWSTYVAAAFLRQFPQHYEFSAEAYSKAERWVQDQDLLSLATDAIVPQKSFYVGELDHDLMKKGKWSVAARKLVQQFGHSALIPPSQTPEEGDEGKVSGEPDGMVQEEQSMSKQEELVKRVTSDTVLRSNVLFKAKLLHEIGKSRIKASATMKGEKDGLLMRAYAPLAEAYPLFKTVADDLCERNRLTLHRLQRTGHENAVVKQEHHIEKPKERETTSWAQSGDMSNSDNVDLFTQTRIELRDCLLSLGLPTKDLVESVSQHEDLLETEIESIEEGRTVTSLKEVNRGSTYFIDWNCEWTPVIVLKVDTTRNTVDVRYKRIMAGSKGLVERQIPFQRLRHLPTKRLGAVLRESWRLPISPGKELKRVNRCIPKGLRPIWSEAKIDYKSQERTALFRKVALRQSSLTSNRAAVDDTNKHQKSKPADVMTRLKLKRAQKVVQGTFGLVVEAVHRYEEYLKSLKAAVATGAKCYRDAKTHVKQIVAFNETTRMLCEFRSIVCAVVEVVMKWRKTLSSLGQAAQELIWDGRNLLLEIILCTNFLAEHSEVRQWFGPDLLLTRNPFVLAIPLDEHPRTPRSAIRKELVNGRETLVINHKLAAEREVDDAAIEKCWQRIAQSPTHWPACSRPLWDRIRAVETVLRAEEKLSKSARQRLLGPVVAKS